MINLITRGGNIVASIIYLGSSGSAVRTATGTGSTQTTITQIHGCTAAVVS